MVSKTTQHPPPLILYFDFGKGRRGGGGEPEKVRGAIVHKAGSKIPT